MAVVSHAPPPCPNGADNRPHGRRRLSPPADNEVRQRCRAGEGLRYVVSASRSRVHPTGAVPRPSWGLPGVFPFGFPLPRGTRRPVTAVATLGGMTLSMSPAERQAFLADVHVGVMSVAQGSQGPLTVPIWYTYEPGAMVSIITGASSRKATLIAVAGRFSLCAQSETAPYKY